jgi:trans-2,3-dihydro-3-hydroxyanthranilate isomerase
MANYELLQVDAFTTEPLRGNPCAVLPEASGLDEAQMQAIAMEMNLSETAFVLPSNRADFRCRYFTPAEEVPLAGHPTIATVHALTELGRIRPATQIVTLELSVGVIEVERRIQDDSLMLVMTQLPPTFERRLNRGEAAAALRLPESMVRTDLPVQVVSTGTPQLMVPVASLTTLLTARPDEGQLLSLREKAGFFSVHAFTQETEDPASAAHSRHWGFSGSGLFEDPVTGSASGGLVAYLLQYEAIEPGSHRLEQGDGMQRPGRVYAEVTRDEAGNVAAPKIGGYAVTVMRGTLTI